MTDEQHPSIPIDNRSLRSGSSQMDQPPAVDDTEQLLKKSRSASDRTSKEQTAGSSASHRSHWIYSEVLPKLRSWLDGELERRLPVAVEAHLEGYAKEYVAESVREYMDEIMGRWGQSGSIDNPLTDAVHRQLQVHLALVNPLGPEPSLAPALPTGSLPPKLHPESVYVVKTRADPPGATAEPPVYLPVIPGGRREDAPDPPGGPSEDDSEDDDRRRNRRNKDRRRKSRSRSRSRRRKSRQKGHRKWRNSSSGSDSEDSYDSDSDAQHRGRSVRGARRNPVETDHKLQVIRPLNDLFTKAVNYQTYRLRNRSKRYDSEVARHMGKIQKRLDVQMKSHPFSGDDPIAVLGFLERFRGACDHNGVSEGAAMWCLQFYLTGSARSILQSRLGMISMAVDADHSEMLKSYKEAINYLLRTYATDEVIAEAYTETVSYRQSSGTTESDYSQRLWEKALRCGCVFSDRRMKAMFVEGLLPTTRAQVRKYLATHPSDNYQSITRYAEALGETYRSGKRGPSNVDFKTTRAKKATSARSILATESDDGIRSYTDTDAEAAEVLAIGSRSGTYQASTISPAPSSVASPPSSYYPSRPSTPHTNGSPGLTGRVGNRNGTVAYCRICLSKEHTRCPWIPEGAVDSLMAERERNYQQRREEGTFYTRPFGYNRPYGPVHGATAKPKASGASVNVVEFPDQPHPAEPFVPEAMDHGVEQDSAGSKKVEEGS